MAYLTVVKLFCLTACLALAACGGSATEGGARQGPEGVDLSYNVDGWQPFVPYAATQQLQIDTYPNGWIRISQGTPTLYDIDESLRASRARFSVIGAKAVEMARQRNHTHIAIITLEQVPIFHVIQVGTRTIITNRLNMFVGHMLFTTGDRAGRGWTPVDRFEAVLQERASTLPLTPIKPTTATSIVR